MTKPQSHRWVLQPITERGISPSGALCAMPFWVYYRIDRVSREERRDRQREKECESVRVWETDRDRQSVRTKETNQVAMDGSNHRCHGIPNPPLHPFFQQRPHSLLYRVLHTPYVQSPRTTGPGSDSVRAFGMMSRGPRSSTVTVQAIRGHVHGSTLSSDEDCSGLSFPEKDLCYGVLLLEPPANITL